MNSLIAYPRHVVTGSRFETRACDSFPSHLPHHLFKRLAVLGKTSPEIWERRQMKTHHVLRFQEEIAAREGSRALAGGGSFFNHQERTCLVQEFTVEKESENRDKTTLWINGRRGVPLLMEQTPEVVDGRINERVDVNLAHL